MPKYIDQELQLRLGKVDRRNWSNHQLKPLVRGRRFQNGDVFAKQVKQL